MSANPARLRGQLLRAPAYAKSGWPVSYRLLRIITDLHHQLVQPRLDAALWQILAGQADMRDLGTVHDRAGRIGDAVAFTDHSDVERLVLIISPSTGRLLGWEDIR